MIQPAFAEAALRRQVVLSRLRGRSHVVVVKARLDHKNISSAFSATGFLNSPSEPKKPIIPTGLPKLCAYLEQQ
jgi:hypothetical protein